ncbi:hypothetical protein D3C85_1902220 [compost metagenome]
MIFTARRRVESPVDCQTDAGRHGYAGSWRLQRDADVGNRLFVAMMFFPRAHYASLIARY